MARRIPFTPKIKFLSQYGRREIAGADQIIKDAHMRRWTAAKKEFVHRVHNGLNDPFTYFHIAKRLAEIEPEQRFTAKQLAEDLTHHEPRIWWDATTVGRVLADMIESFEETYAEGHRPLVADMTWAGRGYRTSWSPIARAAIQALLDDLVKLGEKVQRAEAVGVFPKRDNNVLTQCPSLMPAVAAAA